MIPLDAIVHFTPGDLLEDAAAGMHGEGGGRHRDVVNVAAAGNIVACLLLTNLATVTPIIVVRRPHCGNYRIFPTSLRFYVKSKLMNLGLLPSGHHFSSD